MAESNENVQENEKSDQKNLQPKKEHPSSFSIGKNSHPADCKGQDEDRRGNKRRHDDARSVEKLTCFGIRRLVLDKIIRRGQLKNVNQGEWPGIESLVDSLMNPKFYAEKLKKEEEHFQEIFLSDALKDDYRKKQKEAIKQKHFKGRRFKIRVYKQILKKPVYILQHFLPDDGPTRAGHRIDVNVLILFYRPNEIYVLPSGKGYNHVEWCTDFDFPSIIAQRLLATEGQMAKKVHGLTGDAVHIATTFKAPTRPSSIGEPEEVVGFSAGVRQDSSLFNLPISAETSLMAEVGQGFIRFSKSFNKYQLLLIVSHLSVIYNRTKPTYKFGHVGDPKFEETDDSIYAKALVVVPPELKKRLENIFRQQLKKAIDQIASITPTPKTMSEKVDQSQQQPKDDEKEEQVDVTNFQFIHKHIADFMKGDNFCLVYCPPASVSLTTSTVRHFYERPSLQNVLTAITEYFLEKKGQKSKIAVSTLLHFKLIYSVCGTQWKEPVTMLSCIEGDMSFEGNVYWRTKGAWFHIPSDFIGANHQEFLHLLQKSLMDPKTCGVAHLTHKWLNRQQQEEAKTIMQQICTEHKITGKKMFQTNIGWENIFNSSYHGKPNFLVGDKKLAKGAIEMFDILQIVEDEGSRRRHAYLYHVKEGFDGTTRVACAQIENAATFLRQVLTSSANDTMLTKIHEMALKTAPNFVQKFGVEDLDKFTRLFRHSTLVFVFIDKGRQKVERPTKFKFSGNSHRTLALERNDTRTRLSVEDLEKIFRTNDVGNQVDAVDVPGFSLEKLAGWLGMAWRPQKDLNEQVKEDWYNEMVSECAQTVHGHLVAGNYFDVSGQVKSKFLYSTQGSGQSDGKKGQVGSSKKMAKSPKTNQKPSGSGTTPRKNKKSMQNDSPKGQTNQESQKHPSDSNASQNDPEFNNNDDSQFMLYDGCPPECSKMLWRLLSRYRSSFARSLVPKLSLLKTAGSLGFNMDLKICEVFVDSDTTLNEDFKSAVRKYAIDQIATQPPPDPPSDKFLNSIIRSGTASPVAAAPVDNDGLDVTSFTNSYDSGIQTSDNEGDDDDMPKSKSQTQTQLPVATAANASKTCLKIGGKVKVTLTLKDLKTLEDDVRNEETQHLTDTLQDGSQADFQPNWLTDPVVDAYFAKLFQPNPKLFCVSAALAVSFFSESLEQEGDWQELVDDIQTKYNNNDDDGSILKLLFIPLQVNGNHWCLIVVSFETCQVSYYDPMNDMAKLARPEFLKLCRLLKKVTAASRNELEWTVVNKSGASQDDGRNCGLYILAYAHRVAHNHRLMQPVDVHGFRHHVLRTIVGQCDLRAWPENRLQCPYCPKTCNTKKDGQLRAGSVACNQCGRASHNSCRKKLWDGEKNQLYTCQNGHPSSCEINSSLSPAKIIKKKTLKK